MIIDINKSSVWGSLTGIRPAKIAEKLIESGVCKTSAAERLMQEYHVSAERAKLCADIAEKTLSLKSSLKPNDISLYISIPFCPTRCAYCSFVSNNVEKSFSLIEPYKNAILHELRETAKLVKELGLDIISVYIGGGTPTVLSPSDIGTIMKEVMSNFDLSNLREYTVEAGRPDTITNEALQVIKSQGANRICINPQSMSADVLAAIGRKHTSEDVLHAVKLAKGMNFELNMDIIAGLPSDTPDGFSKTLDSVLCLRPENITVHTLSQKKGTRIMLEKTALPAANDVESMLTTATKKLLGSGYLPYYLYRQKYISGGFENIGWSLSGFDGVYNKLMMDDIGTVFAVGAGGVTKLILPNGRIERMFNMKYPKEYILQASKITDKIEKVKKFIAASFPS